MTTNKSMDELAKQVYGNIRPNTPEEIDKVRTLTADHTDIQRALGFLP
jgi:hypothetical protein